MFRYSFVIILALFCSIFGNEDWTQYFENFWNFERNISILDTLENIDNFKSTQGNICITGINRSNRSRNISCQFYGEMGKIIWLINDFGTRGTYIRKVTLNYNAPITLPKELDSTKSDSTVIVARTKEQGKLDYAIINRSKIGNNDVDKDKFMNEAREILSYMKRFQKYPGVNKIYQNKLMGNPCDSLVLFDDHYYLMFTCELERHSIGKYQIKDDNLYLHLIKNEYDEYNESEIIKEVEEYEIDGKKLILRKRVTDFKNGKIVKEELSKLKYVLIEK